MAQERSSAVAASLLVGVADQMQANQAIVVPETDEVNQRLGPASLASAGSKPGLVVDDDELMLCVTDEAAEPSLNSEGHSLMEQRWLTAARLALPTFWYSRLIEHLRWA